MYLSELISALRRRWWAVVLGLLGTAALVYFVMGAVPLNQAARASVLVLPPSSAVTTTGNPYLALGGLEPAADVLANAMNNGSVHNEIAPRGSSGDYSVYRDSSSSGPLLVVDATDTDPARALAMVSAVLDKMPGVFTHLQTQVEVAPNNLMSLSMVTQDDEALPSAKTRTRALLVAVVGGLALTVFGTSLLDGLLVRRRNTKTERAAERENAAPPPAKDAPATRSRKDTAVTAPAEPRADELGASRADELGVDERGSRPALTPP